MEIAAVALVVVAMIARSVVLSIVRMDRQAKIEDRQIREDRLAKAEADIKRLKEKIQAQDWKVRR